jgi:alpha-L-fucosidase
VELFADAGAKYFVFVTVRRIIYSCRSGHQRTFQKHHDGFALFDTKSSTHRSSYHLGPKRDFLRELFDAAKEEQPLLHRGTYYSMPEWYVFTVIILASSLKSVISRFNPDAGPYGFGSWPGHLAQNAFNHSETEPYTGRLPVDDYLEDVQLAHMRQLAFEYETEIMVRIFMTSNHTCRSPPMPIQSRIVV